MHDYFYGWYMKLQSETHTLAVIPAVHQTNRHSTSCSVQIITDDGAWNVNYAAKEYHRGSKCITISDNMFSGKSVSLSIHTPEIDIKGKVDFGPLSPLKYNIMGPFALVPFMECRHNVWSMCHSVSGKIDINGKEYLFQNDNGYWEGDSGRSFPSKYIWTQCFLPQGSVMLSVAEIPALRFSFTGIIGIVLWQGKEYRIATYLGAKAVEIHEGTILIVQGNMELEVRMTGKKGLSLKAPDRGDMSRIIHENVSCSSYFRFRRNGKNLFEYETDSASFEYEYFS